MKPPFLLVKPSYHFPEISHYPLVNVNSLLQKTTLIFMAKSTISMAHGFNIMFLGLKKSTPGMWPRDVARPWPVAPGSCWSPRRLPRRCARRSQCGTWRTGAAAPRAKAMSGVVGTLKQRYFIICLAFFLWGYSLTQALQKPHMWQIPSIQVPEMAIEDTEC